MGKPSTSAINLAETIKWRYHERLYPAREVPPERELAADFGVSRTTVRRALTFLLAEERVERLANGRLAFVRRPGERDGAPIFALMLPSLGSASLSSWYHSLTVLAGQRHFSLRTYQYNWWNDPILKQVFEFNDGIFMVPRPNMPEWMAKKFMRHEKPIVSLDWDLSALELPSLVTFPTAEIWRLLDACRRESIRSYDLVNFADHNDVIHYRFDAWRLWRERNGLAGELFDFSTPKYREKNTRQWMTEFLATLPGRQERLLLFVTSGEVAVTLRAAADIGLTAGRDFSLATVDGEGAMEFMVPEVASLERPDLTLYLNRYLDRMMAEEPLLDLLQTEVSNSRLHAGESIVAENLAE